MPRCKIVQSGQVAEWTFPSLAPKAVRSFGNLRIRIKILQQVTFFTAYA